MYYACDAGGAADGRRPLPPTQLRSGLRAARNAELDKRREVAALSRRVTRERRRVAHDSHVLQFRQRAMSTREELGKLSMVAQRRELGDADPADEVSVVELARRDLAEIVQRWSACAALTSAHLVV